MHNQIQNLLRDLYASYVGLCLYCSSALVFVAKLSDAVVLLVAKHSHRAYFARAETNSNNKQLAAATEVGTHLNSFAGILMYYCC
jgi:hypothetical protein